MMSRLRSPSTNTTGISSAYWISTTMAASHSSSSKIRWPMCFLAIQACSSNCQYFSLRLRSLHPRSKQAHRWLGDLPLSRRRQRTSLIITSITMKSHRASLLRQALIREGWASSSSNKSKLHRLSQEQNLKRSPRRTTRMGSRLLKLLQTVHHRLHRQLDSKAAQISLH